VLSDHPSISTVSSDNPTTMTPSDDAQLNEASITSMFDSLAEEDNPYVVSMEGITNLCESLEIDPMEDIRILVLLWKMGANAQPGHINRDEWMKGCIQLKADSIAKLKKLMPGLDVGFLERSEFKDFFKVLLFDLLFVFVPESELSLFVVV